VLVQGFASAGWEIPSPAATMFAWAPIPEPFREMGSLEFSKLLLAEADVAVSPGVGFGEYGDDHVRIALVVNEHRIRQAVRSLKQFFRRDGRLSVPESAAAGQAGADVADDAVIPLKQKQGS
jgi:alanine-synthesizing transaminase